MAAAVEVLWHKFSVRRVAAIYNGYAFLKLQRRTGDAVWLERARAFAMNAAAQCRETRDQLGRGRYSLWTGDIGLAVYLWQCLKLAPEFPTIDVYGGKLAWEAGPLAKGSNLCHGTGGPPINNSSNSGDVNGACSIPTIADSDSNRLRTGIPIDRGQHSDDCGQELPSTASWVHMTRVRVKLATVGSRFFGLPEARHRPRSQ